MIGWGESFRVAGGGSGWQVARSVFLAAYRQALPPKMGTKKPRRRRGFMSKNLTSRPRASFSGRCSRPSHHRLSMSERYASANRRR